MTNMNNVIINADDFGISHEVNIAIIQLLKSGKIHRTTLMVNMPFCNEAYEMAKINGFLDKVGLHINLTDGKPLSQAILKTRFCRNGEFDLEQVESGVRLYVSKVERSAVKFEVQAQFDKFKEIFGYYPHHVDGHRHVHNYFGFLPTIVNLAKKAGVESMRIGINLFDKAKAPISKKIYKKILNTYIRSNFNSTDYMGSWLEYVEFYRDTEDKTIEIMVHPTIHAGKIVDIIYNRADKEYYEFDNIKLR